MSLRGSVGPLYEYCLSLSGSVGLPFWLCVSGIIDFLYFFRENLSSAVIHDVKGLSAEEIFPENTAKMLEAQVKYRK